MGAERLVDQVIQGVSPGRVILEAETTPVWKPGQPVPEGYHVVFGKLRKPRSRTRDYYWQHDAHRHSSKAWDASARARASGKPEDHSKAAELHRAAQEAHEYAAGSDEVNWNSELAKAHRQAAELHGKLASHHEVAHMFG